VSRPHFSSLITLQMRVVCPVFESITVLRGRQLQVTVLAFSCLTTTQCWMSSAVAGGSWLRMGGGVAATGCFLAAQPARSKQNTSQHFLMPSVFARMRPLVDGNLGYRPEAKILAKAGADIHLIKALQPFAREAESRSTTFRDGANIWLYANCVYSHWPSRFPALRLWER
jgi:hypothetical protein